MQHVTLNNGIPMPIATFGVIPVPDGAHIRSFVPRRDPAIMAGTAERRLDI